MTDSKEATRDWMAAQYGLNRFPIQNVETRKDFTQDINFSRRMTVTGAYQAGFDAGYQVALDEANKRIQKLREALEFYALKSNYSLCDEGRNYQVEYKCYELNEKTYADEELGKKARAALKEDDL